MTGYVYVGHNPTTGRFKIGETNQTLSHRVYDIRQVEGKSFRILGYAKIQNSSHATTKAIEGLVRLELERKGYKVTQNDHFTTSATTTQFYSDAMCAIHKACKYCKIEWKAS